MAELGLMRAGRTPVPSELPVLTPRRRWPLPDSGRSESPERPSEFRDRAVVWQSVTGISG